MNAENARNPSRTAPLVIRSPLEVDLIDRNGQLVFAAGTVLTPEQIRFVEQRGIQVIVDAPSSDTSPIQSVDPETALLRPMTLPPLRAFPHASSRPKLLLRMLSID